MQRSHHINHLILARLILLLRDSYAKRCTCRRRVSVRPSVRPSANNATR